MNITQSDGNGVIKWDSFNVGGSATVNFKGPETGYNTLNYVNVGGGMSQIYGTINANNNGNIFIVNPAGVQIGNSAQINVGSLYVSNKYLNENKLGDFAGAITQEMIDSTKTPDAALMSLGNINATNVTFEGDGRIVIDSERIKNAAGEKQLGYQNINITTADNNTGNVIIGYEAYDEDKKTYAGANGNTEKDRIATINDDDYITKADGYMWVEDVEQLQAINTNLGGNYALRNSIDATSTEQNGFKAIGSHNYAFKGKFDGIDYNIFGLNINNLGKDNAGLFGVTDSAVINNVTLVGGKITGGSDVGAIVGEATNGTQINNVINSAVVSGDAEVGGIVGSLINSTVTNAVNTGTVTSKGETDIAEGVTASNAGGLIGHMNNGKLLGDSYNLGAVTGQKANVGGLVGYAVNSYIGDGKNLVYNRLDVEGAYNVGGIVGNMEGTTVQNAENSGNVTATSFDVDGGYTYHSAQYHGEKTEKVNVANVGGIAGKADDTVKTDDKKV